jgi:hypothetical protein
MRAVLSLSSCQLLQLIHRQHEPVLWLNASGVCRAPAGGISMYLVTQLLFVYQGWSWLLPCDL